MKVSKLLARKIFLVIVFAITSFASCKKDSGSSKPTTSTPPSTTVLSKILFNTAGQPTLGKPGIEFTYNGKVLIKAVVHSYLILDNTTPIDFSDTITFKYNVTGGLSGATYKYSSGDHGYVSSSVTANTNGNITFISNAPSATNNFTVFNTSFNYQNDLLTGGLNTMNDLQSNFTYTKFTYTFNSAGNNTTQINEVTTQSSDMTSTITNLTFDSSHNLYQALPLWAFFVFTKQGSAYFPPYVPGTNNPLTATNNGKSISFTYQYNSNGYPTSIAWNDGTATSYSYEYAKLN